MQEEHIEQLQGAAANYNTLYEMLGNRFTDSQKDERAGILSDLNALHSDVHGDIAEFYDELDENGVDAYDWSLQSEDDLYRRLPVERIEDDEIRNEVTRVFMEDCPDAFWTAPASGSGKYHVYEQRGPFGLWYHVLNAFNAFERLADGHLHSPEPEWTEYEADAGRAGILLHDLFKYGDGFEEEHMTEDHDMLAVSYLVQETDLPEIAPETIGCVATHMGPWSTIQEPATALEKEHHRADMIASAEDLYTNDNYADLHHAAATTLEEQE